MEEIEKETDLEVEEEDSEFEEMDDFDNEEEKPFASITEKKLRVQMINQEVKKLLAERDELEVSIDQLEDDLPVED